MPTKKFFEVRIAKKKAHSGGHLFPSPKTYKPSPFLVSVEALGVAHVARWCTPPAAPCGGTHD